MVRGRVQGVFYRASAREKAVQLGVSGFVRNEPDGSVYIEASGDKEGLQQFVAWCRKGPPRALVTEVVVQEIVRSGFNSFIIER